MSKKWVAIVALMAGFTIVTNLILTDLFHFSLLDLVEDSLRKPGIGAALSIVGLLAVDVFLPVASSMVMVLSGVLFGTVPGGALSLIGSLIGNIAGYETVRKYGPDFCLRLVKPADLERMRLVFERHGAVGIILSRPLPVAMETMSLVAGLVGMGRGKFVASNVIGTLPVSLLYAYAGRASMQTSTIVPAIFMLVCVPAIGWLLVQRLRR